MVQCWKELPGKGNAGLGSCLSPGVDRLKCLGCDATVQCAGIKGRRRGPGRRPACCGALSTVDVWMMKSMLTSSFKIPDRSKDVMAL